jgi:hypothetical protein
VFVTSRRSRQVSNSWITLDGLRNTSHSGKLKASTLTTAQSHVGDVVQCWRVEKFVPVPFPLIPRWITYRLLSRNTVGVIVNRPDGNVTALEIIESLYEGNALASKWKRTTNPEVVAQRLLDWVSSNAFEHLVCHCYNSRIRTNVGGT